MTTHYSDQLDVIQKAIPIFLPPTVDLQEAGDKVESLLNLIKQCKVEREKQGNWNETFTSLFNNVNRALAGLQQYFRAPDAPRVNAKDALVFLQNVRQDLPKLVDCEKRRYL